MKIKINVEKVLWLILISIFLLGNQIRYGISPGLYHVNILYLLALMILFRASKGIARTRELVLWCLVTIHACLINVINGCNTSQIIGVVLIVYLPMLMLRFDIKEKVKEPVAFLSKIVKVFNLFVYLQLAIYFFDAIFNGAIIKWMVSHLTPHIDTYVSRVTSYSMFGYRFVSYLGQSLFVSEVFAVFLILNTFFRRRTKTVLCNRYISYVVALLGVLITGSRTGAAITLLIIVYDVLFEKHRTISIILGVGIGLAFVSLGVFDVIIGRFSQGTLTAGRNEAWSLIFNSNLKIHLFYGSGAKTYDTWGALIGMRQAGYALEYPVLSMFYRYGVINTLLWIVLMFISPLRQLIKNKEFEAVFFFSLLILNVNTFNGISEIGDLGLLYALCFQLISITCTVASSVSTKEYVQKLQL